MGGNGAAGAEREAFPSGRRADAGGPVSHAGPLPDGGRSMGGIRQQPDGRDDDAGGSGGGIGGRAFHSAGQCCGVDGTADCG